MKRENILDLFDDDEARSSAEEAINYLEDKFNQIRDLLTVESIDDLDNIAEARRIADSVSDDLY